MKGKEIDLKLLKEEREMVQKNYESFLIKSKALIEFIHSNQFEYPSEEYLFKLMKGFIDLHQSGNMSVEMFLKKSSEEIITHSLEGYTSALNEIDKQIIKKQ